MTAGVLEGLRVRTRIASWPAALSPWCARAFCFWDIGSLSLRHPRLLPPALLAERHALELAGQRDQARRLTRLLQAPPRRLADFVTLPEFRDGEHATVFEVVDGFLGHADNLNAVVTGQGPAPAFLVSACVGGRTRRRPTSPTYAAQVSRIGGGDVERCHVTRRAGYAPGSTLIITGPRPMGPEYFKSVYAERHRPSGRWRRRHPRWPSVADHPAVSSRPAPRRARAKAR